MTCAANMRACKSRHCERQGASCPAPLQALGSRCNSGAGRALQELALLADLDSWHS